MLSLKTIKKYEPEMKRLGVSKVARGRSGFLTAYKRAGSPEKLSEKWKKRRLAFLARHGVQYRKYPTKRHRLSMIAWAYDPER